MKPILYDIAFKIDRFLNWQYPCNVCRTPVTLYTKVLFKQICTSCSMHLIERRSKPQAPCGSCGVPRLGIEMTFRKDYGEKCFPCFFAQVEQRSAYRAVGQYVAPWPDPVIVEEEEIDYHWLREDF